MVHRTYKYESAKLVLCTVIFFGKVFYFTPKLSCGDIKLNHMTHDSSIGHGVMDI